VKHFSWPELGARGIFARMRKTYEKQPVACTDCPRLTTSPRKGRCFACYQRIRRGIAAPPGSKCRRCKETDLLVLSVTKFGVLCLNDAARVRAVA